MDIYVVQPNDTIEDIAKKFGVSVAKLVRDNEIEKPNQLVPGQTIVITYPEQTYTVQSGDTLQSISENFGVSILQLLRNNPFLSNRKVRPGETITIRYNTTGKLTTNGFTYPYMNIETLKKTLPSLTYLTVYNYQITRKGELIPYFDDSDIIQAAKDYGTIPLMMLTAISPQVT